ncbi:hypothetical protein [Xanthomonas arboricola]|uniref:hypothetical protein n=1 Tax=Xanthomonas arboricola TaxID=56448 RepID=UPI000F8888CC|nr:hypothetical protein [Xanthomonas arboricola]MDN0202256.1 hypothetical protein [Xanthomonas arboricola pv. corylina]MDN0271440.1 hypothetical protein [Xanthomonas arboricola pv. pruni]MDN0301088.1 hypothetical protein [Xanthomonas arboricola pv. pruni]MDN0305796.1 hypothetical protein [Xanthomonas arboricola pv. pruni]MEA5148365.1 hypothetical protein [Xanthomonas arboricola]
MRVLEPWPAGGHACATPPLRRVTLNADAAELQRRDQRRLEKSNGPVMRNCTGIVAPGGEARGGDAKPWRCNGSVSWAFVAFLMKKTCIS